jgi:hypothetical protein
MQPNGLQINNKSPSSEFSVLNQRRKLSQSEISQLFQPDLIT